MNRGLGTGFVCVTEGNKHTKSNLHPGCQGVSVCVCVWNVCVPLCGTRVTHSPFFFPLLRTAPHLHIAAGVTVTELLVSESAGSLTNRSFRLSDGITGSAAALLWHTCHLEQKGPGLFRGVCVCACMCVCVFWNSEWCKVLLHFHWGWHHSCWVDTPALVKCFLHTCHFHH